MSDLASPLTCPSVGRSLYVYYRVHAGKEAAARTAIETMQATLKPLHPGLCARLMCRVDAPSAKVGDTGAEQTWMEVYEHPDGVSHACETTLQALASALPDDMFGPRHVEIFSCVGVP